MLKIIKKFDIDRYRLVEQVNTGWCILVRLLFKTLLGGARILFQVWMCFIMQKFMEICFSLGNFFLMIGWQTENSEDYFPDFQDKVLFFFSRFLYGILERTSPKPFSKGKG